MEASEELVEKAISNRLWRDQHERDKCIAVAREAVTLAVEAQKKKDAEIARNFADNNYGQGIHAVEWARPKPMCEEIATAIEQAK